MDKSKLSDSTAYSILDSCRHIVSLVHIASRATEKELGLSAAQLYVLQKLAQTDKSLSIKGLAELTHTHQSSVSVVVKKLVEKNLAVSKPAEDDARRIELKVTTKGRRLVATSPEAVQDRLLRAIKSLSEDEGNALRRLLHQVLEAADVREAPPQLFFEDD